MPRLTAELIAESPQFTNPVKDRELDLRGNKIAVIENLGATLDQFDTIDFSDNEIRKLDGFTLLRRLKCIIVNNNRVCRIAEGLETCLPKLETLVLTNNSIEDMCDVDPLVTIKTLTYLSLMRNPVAHKPSYRQYVIFKLPQLRVLDFKRITLKERKESLAMFGGKKGEEQIRALSKRPKTFNPGELAAAPTPSKAQPSTDQIQRIRLAIANAKSLEEVQQLEAMLKAGQIPGHVDQLQSTTSIAEYEMTH